MSSLEGPRGARENFLQCREALYSLRCLPSKVRAERVEKPFYAEDVLPLRGTVACIQMLKHAVLEPNIELEFASESLLLYLVLQIRTLLSGSSQQPGFAECQLIGSGYLEQLRLFKYEFNSGCVLKLIFRGNL